MIESGGTISSFITLCVYANSTELLSQLNLRRCHGKVVIDNKQQMPSYIFYHQIRCPRKPATEYRKFSYLTKIHVLRYFIKS